MLGLFIGAGILLVFISIVCLCGLKVLNPNEAYVLALFGKYHGTLKSCLLYTSKTCRQRVTGHEQYDCDNNRCIEDQAGYTVCVEPGALHVLAPKSVDNVKDHGCLLYTS